MADLGLDIAILGLDNSILTPTQSPLKGMDKAYAMYEKGILTVTIVYGH